MVTPTPYSMRHWNTEDRGAAFTLPYLPAHEMLFYVRKIDSGIRKQMNLVFFHLFIFDVERLIWTSHD